MKNKIFGYARVSSKEQNEERQIVAFKYYGIDERDIYIDKQSGKNFDREQYNILKYILRENDILVIKSIDRLGRNYNMIIDEWKDITKNIKADIVVIDMPLLDTTKNKDLLGTFISDLILQILSYVAEQERTFIKQRQKEGISTTMNKGIKFGRPTIEKPQNYDIVSFVENICMAASDFVKVNNMNIVFDTDEEEKIISFDLDNMERIILNLLSNAIKYGSDNGKIEVTINCTKDVRISVKDNGIGIPKDKQNRVFERFGQVKNKMHTEWEGSGIGLFLVKSLVELNGGEIILNSELGKGSEFIIVLPDKIENNEITKLTEFKNKLDTMNIEFSDIYI